MSDQIITIDENGKVHHPPNCDCGLPGCPDVREAAPEISEAERVCRAKIDAVKDSGPAIFTVEYVDGYHKGVSDMVAALTQEG